MTKYEFLEKLRKDLGYSRKKIAEYLDVSASAIEKYEKGKLDFTHKTKYILGICALSGINNNIFLHNEIKEDDIYDYKLTKFSQKLREILYFLNIEYDEYNIFIIKILSKKLNFIKGENFSFVKDNLHYYFFNQSYYRNQRLIKYISNKKNFLEEAYKNLDKFSMFQPDFYKGMSKKEIIEKLNTDCELDLFELYLSLGLQILFLYILDFFNFQEFYDKEEIDLVYQIIENENIFSRIFKIDNESSIFNIKKLKQLFPTIKKTIEELEKTGKPVTKETIKEFKLELETGGITASCPEITDPKDQKILELLQYAPPAFKDKIIEKLEKFRDEVEKF